MKKGRSLTARYFFDPVVRALGTLSSFQAGVDVPMRDVINRVLQDMDVDQDELGPSTSRGDKKPKVVLNIEFAFRNQRAEYLGKKRPRKTAYCIPGSRRGFWALTTEGVEKARELCGPVTVTPDSIVETEGGDND